MSERQAHAPEETYMIGSRIHGSKRSVRHEHKMISATNVDEDKKADEMRVIMMSDAIVDPGA
jgi:hypothetical protein